ncbi:MAG: diphosphomevalonate decarboxylase [Gammaproteobacteria bacterium]|nr:diphosphomevalonate decarboxylase [Gammaproteobacteria bacterium]
MPTTAIAHPNIALLKYWGKQDGPGNRPATPSMSITLDGLTTTTTVEDADADALRLNGRPVRDAKIETALADWRREYAIGPLAISSRNDFPTAAGLASSASGFAALATAIDAHCGLRLSDGERSALARRGSGSAARSIHGGFVALAAPDWHGVQVLAPEAWPLAVVVAITTSESKAVSSTAGMDHSKTTSPYFAAWAAAADADFEAMKVAVAHRDFVALAELAEASCLKMHALMLSSRPPLIYWRGATVECLRAIRELRAGGCRVFGTVDAGPQVKAVCEPQDAERVEAILKAVPGVVSTLRSGLGRGARVVDS